jgi:hypothetical protein
MDRRKVGEYRCVSGVPGSEHDTAGGNSGLPSSRIYHTVTEIPPASFKMFKLFFFSPFYWSNNAVYYCCYNFNEELRGFYFSPDIPVIKLRTVRWPEHVARLGDEWNAY